MAVDLERGWMSIPGIREKADRTIEEQMKGVTPALAEAKGRSVLDLGCAEGAIGKRFAEAGAREVLGVEILESHLAVARLWCADTPQVRFLCRSLDRYMAEHPPVRVWDIVLALGVIHKVKFPDRPLRYAAQVCRDLLLFRAPAHAWNGLVRSKHYANTAHVPTVMAEEGFVLEKHLPGARGEGVEYWRRKS